MFEKPAAPTPQPQPVSVTHATVEEVERPVPVEAEAPVSTLGPDLETFDTKAREAGTSVVALLTTAASRLLGIDLR